MTNAATTWLFAPNQTPKTCPLALEGASWAYAWLGRWDEAEKEGQKALSVAQQFSDNDQLSFATWVLSSGCVFKEELSRAIEYGELGVMKAPAPGNKAFAQAALGSAWCRSGQVNRGVETVESVAKILRAGRVIPADLTCRLFLGEGYWLAQQHDMASKTLKEVVELAER